MMFDTLVGAGGGCVGEESSLYDDEDNDDTSIFKSTNDSMEMSTDLLMEYLKPYHQFRDGMESATDPDLSWDEGDLPNNRLIQVWSFNDFMGQYNEIYAWLNNIQVQYHDGKKKEGSSPRVEGYLKELEKDIQKRERFLRESGRMVGVYPELEGEVVWRMEHLMAKWDMLASLRNKARTNTTDLPDVYSDIELEVRCLRKWLKEMEARIDPLQFSRAQQWTTRDREKKMMEYQVLQTDIESHGRIVKLVLSLCQDLGQNPGQYDLNHALKVAKSLERRWHQIWLRSLEWQCLLEQWLQYPAVCGSSTPTSVNPLSSPLTFGCHVAAISSAISPLADTDEEEPVNKMKRLAGSRREDGVPRLVHLFASSTFSPAATLLRVKKRKRVLAASDSAANTLEYQHADRKISPRARRRLPSSQDSQHAGGSATDSSQSEEDDSSNSVEGDGEAYVKNVGLYDAMNTSEDTATNSDETPRLHIHLNDHNDPYESSTIFERTGSIETPRTVIEGPTSSNLLNMLAKLEAAEAKEMERRTLDAAKTTAPITFCELTETEGEDTSFSACSYRFSKSGHHSIEYTMEYGGTGSEDYRKDVSQSGLDNRTASESNLDMLLEAGYAGARPAGQPWAATPAGQPSCAGLNNDLNTTLINWSSGSFDSHTGPLMHSSPLEGKGMDICDARGLTRGKWDLTRGNLGDRELTRGNLEGREHDFVSLDSLEITSSNSSLVAPNHKFTGFGNDSLEDISSIVGSKSSIHSSQGISLESLSCEDICNAVRLPSDQLDQEVDSKPDQFNNMPDVTQPTTELVHKNFGQKGKKKKRKRTNLSCLDDSQSDIEMEAYCNQLMKSRDYLKTIAKPNQHGDYEMIRESCTKNIEFLKDLLNSWKEENSFISKKKSRETRMLLNDWNCLFEKINCRVHVKVSVDRIQSRTDSVRDRLLAFLPGENETRLPKQDTSGDFFRNQDILTVALYKYKDEMITLEQCKVDIADLNLQLHNIKAKLETSSGKVVNQNQLEDLTWDEDPVIRDVACAQQKISDVYSLWESCHHSTTRNISNAEQTLEKFKQFERELTTLKKGLRKDTIRYRGRKSALRGEGSCDSGISDASSTDNDFPHQREQQLERLRHLATNLEANLHPDSSMSNLINNTLETTSTQLRDLKISFQRLKSTKVKRKKQENNLPHVTMRRPLISSTSTASSTKPSSMSSRRRRVCRAALILNFLLMALMVVAALIQPRCCDAPGLLSMLPQLKYTNGPPPI